MKKRLLSVVLLFALLTALLPRLSLPAAALEKTDDEIINEAMVYLNMKEGNCDSVRADDNGAVSVGMIQWHGPRALLLLQEIIKLIPEFALATLGETFYNEIVTSVATDWNDRIVTQEEKEKLVILLGTDESKQVQFDTARKDLQGYINRGRDRGMSTPALLFYYIDMENQYGSGGANSLLIRARATSGQESFACLYELHSALLDTPSEYVQNYIKRRISTYNYIVKTIGWEELPYIIAYNAEGGEGVLRTQPLFSGSSVTLRPNQFIRSGYVFRGWNVERSSDGAWFVSGIGWCSASSIAAGSEVKGIFADGQSITADAAWVAEKEKGEIYTFHAVWVGENFSLTLYQNNSGVNYALGSDFSAALNTSAVTAGTGITLAIDTEQQHSGNNSLRVEAAQGAQPVCFLTSTSGDESWDGYCADEKQMCVSLWAKAEQDGAKLLLQWEYDRSNVRELTLSSQWRRYVVALDKKKYCGSDLCLSLPAAGKLWLAELQVRDGNTASAFIAENGGVFQTVSGVYGGTYGKLPVPERENYSFIGWYSAASGGELLTDKSAVAMGNFCAYARWKRNWDCAVNGHDWIIDELSAPGCFEVGYNTDICTVCGATRRVDTDPPTGHSFDEWVVRTPASCTQTGTEGRACRTCGIVATRSIPITAHTPGQPIVELMPTCTQSGAGYTACTACGLRLEELTLPAIGHLWGAWTVIQKSDGIADGIKQQTCTVCGQTQTLAIPGSAHEHTYAQEVVLPTCTETGHTQFTCTACGYYYIGHAVAAKEHEWGASIITTPPTALHEGISTEVCLNCGQTRTQSVPPLAGCDGGALCPGSRYTDMPKPDNWAHMGIDFAVDAGLFAGTAADRFSPNGTMTRAMLVSVLFRLAGSPQGSAASSFSDVPAGQWYTDAVSWAAECKVVSGTGNGKFSPNASVTREQIAVFLLRFAAYQGNAVSQAAELSAFPDNSTISAFAGYGMSWAIHAGVISGKKNGESVLLAPKGNATRAEVASILMRYIKPAT